MEGFSANTYGERIADVYDAFFQPPDEATADQVAVLLAMAPGDRILEVGAGTGRLAIPLAAAGRTVTAVEVSAKMADRMRARADDAGVRIGIVVADATETPVAGPFDLALCLFNTLYMVGDRPRQQAALGHMADAMAAGATLVVETFIMRAAEVDENADWQFMRIRHLTADALTISATVIDREAQTLQSQDLLFLDGGVRMLPHQMNYLTLAQLDEMAARAGLDLVERWSDWRRTPYAGEARNAVSVYRRSAESLDTVGDAA